MAISSDGESIVYYGAGASLVSPLPRRSTLVADGRAIPLPILGKAVSNDEEVVGYTIASEGESSEQALWSEETGVVLLSDYLHSQGFDTTGWDFTTGGIDITGDGRVLMGGGLFNGEWTAWRLTRVPEPSTAWLLLGASCWSSGVRRHSR